MLHDKESEFWCYLAGEKKCALQHRLYKDSVSLSGYGTFFGLKMIFSKQPKVVSWRFDVTTDEKAWWEALIEDIGTNEKKSKQFRVKIT